MLEIEQTAPLSETCTCFQFPTQIRKHITARAHTRRPGLCSTRAVSEPVACARTAAQRACTRSHGSAPIRMDFNSGASLQQLHDVLRASWAWIYASLPCCNEIRCIESASFPKSAGQRLVKKTRLHQPGSATQEALQGGAQQHESRLLCTDSSAFNLVRL